MAWDRARYDRFLRDGAIVCIEAGFFNVNGIICAKGKKPRDSASSLYQRGAKLSKCGTES